MEFFETHAHYDDEQFKGDQKKLIPELFQSGVKYIVNCACDMKSCKSTLKLASQYENLYAAIGVHPHSVKELDEDSVMQLYGDLCSSEKVVAVGEIGLDYHYDLSPRDIQQEWFYEQIELAKELELPIIVHSREAAEDTFNIIQDADGGMNGGIIHAYAGSLEMAREYVKMGFHIGVGGMVTFPKVRKIIETVRELPLESLVIETDSPYLAPVPNRGKRNDSRNLLYVVNAIAEIRGITPEEVAEATMQNAKDVFGFCPNA